MAQVIYLHRAIPCAMAQALTTMELVPVPLVPTCDKKWVYKAVDFFQEQIQSCDRRDPFNRLILTADFPY